MLAAAAVAAVSVVRAHDLEHQHEDEECFVFLLLLPETLFFF